MAIKSFATAVVLISGLAVSAVHAQGNGAFMRLGIGKASNDGINQASANIYGGYRWALNPKFALGLEAGYTDLGGRKERYGNDYGWPYYGTETRTDQSGKALTLGLNARWDITEKFYVEAHGGYARYRYRDQGRDYLYTPFNTYASKWRSTLYSTGYYAGLGVGYNITPRASVLVTYDRFNPKYWDGITSTTRMNMDIWGAALELRF